MKAIKGKRSMRTLILLAWLMPTTGLLNSWTAGPSFSKKVGPAFQPASNSLFILCTAACCSLGGCLWYNAATAVCECVCLCCNLCRAHTHRVHVYNTLNTILTERLPGACSMFYRRRLLRRSGRLAVWTAVGRRLARYHYVAAVVAGEGWR